MLCGRQQQGPEGKEDLRGRGRDGAEGEEGIRCTLNSLGSTTYPDKKQLLFVIADGIIFSGIF